MNPFESGDRKNIPAVLVYLFRETPAREALMLHRVSPDRPDDFHAGKWNGLGGKCEADESYLAAAIRETREECGIALPPESLRFAGFLQFPNFKSRKSEDWSVMVFTAEVGAGVQVPTEVAEGRLHWIPVGELLGLNLWPGDREFLPQVLDARPFYGAIAYRSDGSVASAEIRAIFTPPGA